MASPRPRRARRWRYGSRYDTIGPPSMGRVTHQGRAACASVARVFVTVCLRCAAMGGRRATTTSNFGAGNRESHDATPFYRRFRTPEFSTDDHVADPSAVPEPFVCGDARHMDALADASVALVVTSPPYFAGKQYEEELDRDGIPATYLEYLDMLTAVFAECVRVLEPGGRIAVNVANLGRKPYRSLSADVIRILQDELGLLLRGEIIWQKGQGASGSCAWGSFRSPANPVLRDVTERIVVASKGRLDRARSRVVRQRQGLPHLATVSTDDFLALTLDVWPLAPESARRVGHPAPFPVELPEALIELYTYQDDLVLDPFMGSGSTLVAAARTGRRYVGYDLDPAYVALARTRVADALAEPAPSEATSPLLADGRGALEVATAALGAAGFTVEATNRRLAGVGITVAVVAVDATGQTWYVDLAGSASTRRGGVTTVDTAWRTLGRASALRGHEPSIPVLVLTTQAPRPGSDAAAALRAGVPEPVTAVIDLSGADSAAELAHWARQGRPRSDRRRAAPSPRRS